MNHKQQIWIKLESAQEDETVSQQMSGEWYVKGKAFYITYEEQSEAGAVRHLLRYEPNELKVFRRGAVESEQVFRLHEQRRGYYDNRLIKLEVEAYTHQLAIKDQHDGVVLGLPSRLPFSLYWDYELFVGEQSTGRFKLRLVLREETK